MAFPPTHEVHRRRFGRNLGLALSLGSFVVLVFALTLVKISRGDPMQGYDHRPSAALLPQEPKGDQP